MNPPGNYENQQDHAENVHRQSQNNQETMGEVSSGDLHQSSRTADGTLLQPNNNNNNQRRTKWTKDMNTYIVRSYYTALKTAPTTYRKAMYDKWKERYGQNFSEQRICDQRRTIFLKATNNQNQRLRGNWLTQMEVDNIQQEINAVQPQEADIREAPSVGEVEHQE